MSIDEPRMHDPLAAVEAALIEDYLAGRGHTRASLQQLPPAEAAALLAAATRHATLRLSEIESRAHYTDELHGES